MASLAIKNLFHEKVRLVVTLTGIVFSVILTAVQLGIFQGFIAACFLLYFCWADVSFRLIIGERDFRLVDPQFWCK